MTTTVRSGTTQLQLASLESSPNGATLRLAGDWRLPQLDAAAAALSALPRASRIVALDGRALTGFDTAGALVVLRYLLGLGTDAKSVAPQNFAPHHRRILDVVASQLANVTGANADPAARVLPNDRPQCRSALGADRRSRPVFRLHGRGRRHAAHASAAPARQGARCAVRAGRDHGHTGGLCWSPS